MKSSEPCLTNDFAHRAPGKMGNPTVVVFLFSLQNCSSSVGSLRAESLGSEHLFLGILQQVIILAFHKGSPRKCNFPPKNDYIDTQNAAIFEAGDTCSKPSFLVSTRQICGM